MNFKTNFSKPTNVSPRVALENKYRTGRANLLLVVGFTLLNVILALVNADMYMLFSASIPYYLVLFGVILSGGMPEEYYIETDIPMEALFDTSFLVTMIVIAVAILAVYFLCWFFSKNYKTTWLGVALVLFILDTIGMLLFAFLVGFQNMILDVLFHVWVIYYLVVGITSVKKLKDLPPEEETPVAEGEAVGVAENIMGNVMENVTSSETAESSEAATETAVSEATQPETAEGTEAVAEEADGTATEDAPQEQQ